MGPAPLSSSSFTTSVWCSAKCSGLDPWSPRYQGRHWPPAEIQPLSGVGSAPRRGGQPSEPLALGSAPFVRRMPTTAGSPRRDNAVNKGDIPAGSAVSTSAPYRTRNFASVELLADALLSHHFSKIQCRKTLLDKGKGGPDRRPRRSLSPPSVCFAGTPLGATPSGAVPAGLPGYPRGLRTH